MYKFYRKKVNWWFPEKIMKKGQKQNIYHVINAGQKDISGIIEIFKCRLFELNFFDCFTFYF